MDAKGELRTRFKALRDALDPGLRDRWSAELCRHAEHFCTSRRIRSLAVFWPLGSEVDLRPLVRGHGDWSFYFPRVASTHPPRLAWGTEPLQAGLWGLQEPVLTQHFLPPVKLVLAPGLVFDDRGFRIGYGRGYYDAMLGRLSEDVITLGVGFDMQRVPRLPESPHDHPVQGLITETGLQWFHRPENEG